MLIPTLINVGTVLVGWLLTYIAIEVAIAPLESPAMKWRIRIIFAISAVVLVLLTTLSTVRTEREADALPQRIAQYIRNTTPPVALPVVLPPAPPTGLIGAVNGDWGATANGLANELVNFLHDRGDPPLQRAGETNVDFVIRSNAWYSSVMDQYRKQFGDRMVTMAQLLIDKGVLDPRIAELAKNPVNPIGIRILATQLNAAGQKYGTKYSLRQ